MGSVLVQLELTLLVATCAFAMIKGGAAERLGSVAILASYMGDNVAIALDLGKFPLFWIFASDFALAMGLLIIAVRYTSLWLGGAMLLQSIALCSYGLAVTGDGLQNRSYIALNNILSFLMLACILAGTVASWRKRVAGRKAEGAVAAPGIAPA